ncbi:uncharacterized protein ASCRUDRAFT_69883 [Ascoidea rubescens DSM 1968]|uniref:J domain-containing protein n=1 Tax=Ascoidea rubescens DSM 1968 TaxID=1344418 RepID=A0A1D2VIC5_9ASCO|nr:hypothetical protein ASCRUDRAFT_69883 [Ascoidea rubescens DSM 1968]ODV61379.1 hypothetical protein ASCRUDRAFT_69883 [Ascoidea rubescens DSM 1968]
MAEKLSEFMGNTSDNLYHILGIQADNDDYASISVKDLKKAYYKQALIYHPDKFNKNEGNTKIEDSDKVKKFDLILKSYNILTQNDLKLKYDQHLKHKSDLEKEKKYIFVKNKEKIETLLNNENLFKNINGEIPKKRKIEILKREGYLKRVERETSLLSSQQKQNDNDHCIYKGSDPQLKTVIITLESSVANKLSHNSKENVSEILHSVLSNYGLIDSLDRTSDSLYEYRVVFHHISEVHQFVLQYRSNIILSRLVKSCSHHLSNSTPSKPNLSFYDYSQLTLLKLAGLHMPA